VRFNIQVVYDVILLEGVQTRVKRVSNNVTPLVFPTCIIHRSQFYPSNDRSLCYLKTLEHVSSLKISTEILRCVGSRKIFGTTCIVL
jgi:hypothetical protein